MTQLLQVVGGRENIFSHELLCINSTSEYTLLTDHYHRALPNFQFLDGQSMSSAATFTF